MRRSRRELQDAQPEEMIKFRREQINDQKVNETGDLIFTLTDLMKVGGWLFNLNIAILAFNIGR